MYRFLVTYQGLIALFAVALLALIVSYHIFLPLFKKLAAKTSNRFDDLLVEHRAVSRAVQIIPAFILYFGIPHVLSADSFLFAPLTTLNNIYFITVGFLIYDSVLHAFTDHILLKSNKQGIPLNGVRQAALLLGFIVGTILVGSQLTGRSPVVLLSGLGALAAVFMLIFKDSILGFTAGIQIAVFDLVRTGDWIEIPKENINGIVHTVSLTSIHITNWDNTRSILPAYSLVSTPFKNWRLMRETERRRVQRTFPIDTRTIAPLSDEQLSTLKRNSLYKPVVENLERNLPEGERPVNLTAYRLCADAFLKSIPKVDSDRILIVREKDATGYGLPVEIYFFTTYSKWRPYEEFAATTVDRLIAKLPEFGLALYQRQ